MSEVVKPYRDPVAGRGSVELRRSTAGIYSWVSLFGRMLFVTDAHLIGMVDQAERVDQELRTRFLDSEAEKD